MKRRIGVLVLGLIVAMPCAAQAQGGGGGDSLKAIVNFFFQEVTVSARGSSIGTDARGQFRFAQTNLDPDLTAEGEVTCLRVLSTPTGAIASFGGEITKVSPGFSQFFGAATGFQGFASDSGKFSTAQDTFTFFFTSLPPVTCPAPAAGSPVSDGEVIIHDAP